MDVEKALINKHLAVDHFVKERCLFAEAQPKIKDLIEKVLTRMPEEAIETLLEMGTYFVFPERRVNYEVFIPAGSHGHEGTSGVRLIVLSASFCECSQRQQMGLIAHKLGHAYLRHTSATGNDRQKFEDDADRAAIDWGFGEEIAASKSPRAES
jgi:hypothetical protein